MSQPTLLFSKAFALIQQAKRILIVADGSPDGDSLGSSSAMLNWLEREGKPATIFCAASIPRVFTYLDNAHRFTNDPAIFDQPYDLIMTFDAGDLRHCGIVDLLPKIPAGYTLVVFDHHATNERFGHLNIVLTEACSTAEVIYRFFEENGLAIDHRMATSLLSGILMDTSCFSNSSTTSKGMEAAGKLVACGARHTEILHNLIKNKSVPGLKLWGLALTRLEHRPEFDLAYTYFLQKDLAGIPDAAEAVEGMSNFLHAVVLETDTVLVLKELPQGKIKGSLRSHTRDISQLAKLLGGGGHKKAAGFTMDGPLTVEAEKLNVSSLEGSFSGTLKI